MLPSRCINHFWSIYSPSSTNWLLSRGPTNHFWKRQWCTLVCHHLAYLSTYRKIYTSARAKDYHHVTLFLIDGYLLHQICTYHLFRYVDFIVVWDPYTVREMIHISDAWHTFSYYKPCPTKINHLPTSSNLLSKIWRVTPAIVFPTD